MPFARIDLIKGKSSDYRAKVADIVYEGIVGVLKAPDGDRFIVVNEHAPENLIYDRHFLDMDRSPDFILIQVTSTVGNTKELKFAFYRQIADELTSKLGVRPDDIMINMVFVNKDVCIRRRPPDCRMRANTASSIMALRDGQAAC
jgi:phenylpyruvate tautomerase PptA (4-oxalocrotonate tautomerase family)